MKTMIDEMVSRFLGWKLPANFAPDAGMKFVPGPLQQPDGPYWPSGTNLLDATQARQMFEHCTSGAEFSRLIDRLHAAEAERDDLAARLADAEHDRGEFLRVIGRLSAEKSKPSTLGGSHEHT